MRITAIQGIPVAVPLKGGFKNAHAVKSVPQSIVTRVETDAGLVGYGNVDPSPGYSEMTPAEIAATLREALIPAAVGRDPTNVVALVHAMDRAVPARLDAKAAIEMMDIAEAAGLRVVIGHGFGLAVNTLAEVQVAAASPNVRDAVECVGPLKLVEDIAQAPIDQVRGITKLPDAPGIGVTVDQARLEKFRVR